MKCQLCHQERELRNSHIVPEFMFKPLYDAKHRFYSVTPRPDEKTEFMQKGLREKLLCDTCEGRLSRFENYAKKLLYGGTQYTPTKYTNVFDGVDYHKFKLFQLSILWRAGVSGHRFFSEVRLGPHKERLRKMLHTENPGDPRDYPCIINVLTHKNRVVDDLIMNPVETPRVKGGHRCYRFLFGGSFWFYLVSSHRIDEVVSKYLFNKSGRLVFLLDPIENTGLLSNIARDLKAAGKLDRKW